MDRRFPQICTWWSRSVSDGYGGVLFTTPKLIYCRWEDKQVLFRSPSGDEQMSAAVAYLEQPVSIGDYLAKGDERDVGDPTLIDEALEVHQFSAIPDIRIIRTENKAYM